MEARLALPVSIEQVAVVIKQMSRADRERLLDLTPELRQIALHAARRQEDEGLAMVERMRTAVSQALSGRLLSPDEPSIGEWAVPGVTRRRTWSAVGWLGCDLARGA